MNYIRGRREKEYQKHQRRKKKPFETGFWPVSLPEKKSEATQKINFVTLKEDCFGIYKILERAHIEFTRKGIGRGGWWRVREGEEKS